MLHKPFPLTYGVMGEAERSRTGSCCCTQLQSNSLRTQTQMRTRIFISMENDDNPPPPLLSISCLILCECIECACVRVGLVNGRGREDTCSIIRPDKRRAGVGRGEWELDGRPNTSLPFHYVLFLMVAANG